MKNLEMKQAEKGILWGLFFALFGCYLVVGACMAFWNERWPIIMPPQLDVIALLFSIFGEKVAAYLGGILLLIIGGVFCWLGLVVLTHDSNT